MSIKSNFILTTVAGIILAGGKANADLYRCDICPAGYSCDGTNKTQCPAGYKCSGGTKTQCPAGTYSKAGASTCTPCPDGQYQPNAGQSSCQACTDDVISTKAVFFLGTLDWDKKATYTKTYYEYKTDDNGWSSSSNNSTMVYINKNTDLSSLVKDEFKDFLSIKRYITNVEVGQIENILREYSSYMGTIYALCKMSKDYENNWSACGGEFDGSCLDGYSFFPKIPMECVRVGKTKFNDKEWRAVPGSGWIGNKDNKGISGCICEQGSKNSDRYSAQCYCTDIEDYHPRVSCNKKTGKFMITNDLGDEVYDDEDTLHIE